MAPASVRMFEGKKHMWDGATYPQQADADRAADGYRQSGFEVRVIGDEGAWLVFTRREAKAEAKR
jgi:hypothetical protein